MAGRAAKRARAEPLQTLLRKGKISLSGLADLLRAVGQSADVTNVRSRKELQQVNDARYRLAILAGTVSTRAALKRRHKFEAMFRRGRLS